MSRRLRWLSAVVLVAGLVVVTILVVIGSAARQQADDPRSNTAAGAGALGTLLRADGVEVVTTDSVSEALDRTDASTTLVVAAGDELSDADGRRLAAAPAGRLVLLRPNSRALTRFGVSAGGTAPADATVDPDCAVPAARRAGAVVFSDARASYRATGPSEFACYPLGGGSAYLRTSTESGRSVDLLAGGIANTDLGQAGNAALGLNVLGSQPRVVWLMAQETPAATDADRDPTLLPSWWQIAVVQALLALVVVGVWRGRRLGPILTEPLPVTVRAAETVEGHGRLYHRLNARDRAAEALRVASRSRLSRVFGHAQDPLALSAAVAARTGQDAGRVRAVLFGPPPDTDDHLVELTRNLDQLEQEARQL